MNIKMKKIGAERYRQVLFDTKVQQRLSMSRNKRLTTKMAINRYKGWKLIGT